MYPAKRQRIEKASATLCKPFRSPLKTHIDKLEPSSSRTKDDLSKRNPSCTPPNLSPSEVATPQESTSKVEDLVKSDPDLMTKDDLIILQKQYSSLVQQLRKLKQDLDVTEQALTIQRSSQYDHIEDAILNWRDTARQAVDDVFVLSQNRINSMGGLKAWRENTERSSQYWRHSSTSPDSTERAQVDDTTCTNADSIEENEDQAEETEEDQNLSISMMLRLLNVDPHLLGFDEETQSWVT